VFDKQLLHVFEQKHGTGTRQEIGENVSKTALESLLADKAVMADIERLGMVPRGALGLRTAPPVEAVRDTARRMASAGRLESAGTFEGVRAGGLEAIVLAVGRPSLIVQDNSFIVPPDPPVWRERLEPVRPHIEQLLPAVGRIELKRLPEDVHIGTGWLVAEDVVVTNRHVAAFFAQGSGRTAILACDGWGQPVPAQIDFHEEHQRTAAAEHTIVQVLWIEELDEHLPDMALLKVRGAGLPAPIVLRDKLPSPGEDVIAVIGYPAWDSRNDLALMQRLFEDIYGVKRLAPGYIMTPGEGFVFEHDCTTLGGNSGSVVLDAASGEAIGLHYAGEFGIRNRAVRAERIKSRLTELHLQVAVPAAYSRLGDRLIPGPEAEEAARRQPEDYKDREGFQRDFVEGLPAFAPDFANLSGDLAKSRLNGQELKYHHFSVWMSRSRRLAVCTAVNIDGSRLHRFVRNKDRWWFDPRLELGQQIGNELYARNRLDRGHLVRRLDPVWGSEAEARAAMEDTFHYTNATPQHEGFNQVTWVELENYILDNADAHDLKISVFTGPIFRPGDRSYRDVEIPEEFWKIVLMARRGPDGRLRAHVTGYLLSQADLVSRIEFAYGAYRTWQVPIRLIEDRTRIRFEALRPYDPLEASGREGARPQPQVIRSWRDIVLDTTPGLGGIVKKPSGDALERIAGLLRAAQRTISLDYVAEFAAEPPADIQMRVGRIVSGVVGVERVFSTDPRFVRIKIPGLDPTQLGASPFELVEPLREALGAIGVEPDLPTDFCPERPDPQDRALEGVDLLGCWVGNQDTPETSTWALENIKVPQAWEFSATQGQKPKGEGILIAQPDTGVTDHPELDDAIDRTRWADLLDGGDPIDPLQPNDAFDNPGHGTGTGSVVVSREAGLVVGSAPAAKLVPIRCIESVVRITQSRVARAIEHAVEKGCHIITMSLGGLWSRALAVAVAKAIESNVIVLAAAGNCVKLVVWPARFERCLAVAGSNIRDESWKGSCRGLAVDITAPAQHVWRASCKPADTNPVVAGPGEGTSFAVALTAGVAALWLAHHGRQKLIERLGPGEKLQDRFVYLLRQTARVPENGWNKNDFGAGIVDALALLKAGTGGPVPSGELVAGLEAMAAPRRATPLDADQATAAREFLAEAMGSLEAASVDEAVLDRHGLELIWLTLQRQRQKGSLETAGGVIPSEALQRQLTQPELAGLARLVGQR
jgi:endonuclease G